MPIAQLASALLLGAALTAGARPPNLVLILADDLGYGELGCYGQERIRTPHLDALAREGLRFTQFYAGSAVCAPSRDALLTGRHGGHATIRANLELPGREGQEPLPAEVITVAEALRAAGYATGCFGKWGLGEVGSPGDPNRQGFDRFFGYICQRQAHSYYPGHLWRDGVMVPLNNNPPVPGHQAFPKGADPSDPATYARFKGQDYSCDRMEEEALQFIEQHRDRPFFLYYPTPLPHVALQVPEEDVAPYRGQWDEAPALSADYLPHPEPRAAYAAMITRMDRYVGRLVARLKELGLERDTLVLFTSDNGPTTTKEVDTAFFRSTGGLRGLKGSLYEGGLRVPLIACWPGRIAAGGVSVLPAYQPDLLPTLLAAAGRPDLVPAGVDGLSLLPMLEGRADAQKRHKVMYWEYAGGGGQQAVRWGDWKGIRRDILTAGRLTVEVYNLAEDPAETRDAAAEHPEIRARLEALMESERMPSALTPMPALDARAASPAPARAP